MRVALVSFCSRKDEKAVSVVKALESASAAQGHQVDVINGNEDLMNTRLTMYDYIAAIVKPRGLFGGKVAPRVPEFFATSGMISGKKGCALVLKSGFSSEKTCRSLMKALEGEGVKLDYFEVVRDNEHARYVGKKIG